MRETAGVGDGEMGGRGVDSLEKPIVLPGNFSTSPLPAHPTLASPKLGARRGEGGAKSSLVSCGCHKGAELRPVRAL